MTKTKGLTYEEFIQYARQHYCKGGSGYYECWGKQLHDYYVTQFGPITKRTALQMFKIDYEIQKDREGFR